MDIMQKLRPNTEILAGQGCLGGTVEKTVLIVVLHISAQPFQYLFRLDKNSIQRFTMKVVVMVE